MESIVTHGAPTAGVTPRNAPGGPDRRGQLPALLCVPFAGGSEDSFTALRVRLKGHAMVTTACYPGRGRRSSEVRPRSLEEMVAEVDAEMDCIDRPTVLLGYSMGAIVAYEVTLKRERENKRRVSHLVVLASRAPRDFKVNALIEVGGDREFAEAIARQGALPASVLANPLVLGMCLPTLRGDLEACRSYEPSLSKIHCPITMIGGDSDPLAPVSELARWTSYTNEKAECHVVPGGHFFLKRNLDDIVGIIRGRLNDCEYQEDISIC